MTQKKTSDPLLPAIDVPLLEDKIEGDVEGAHGGIGLRHTERDLVVYLINPKNNVGVGSVATLYWGNRNVPVASTPIREGEENLDLIPLTVPAHRIVEYWANPVFGKLRRASGNDSFTEELKLRVSLNRPGGRDPDDQLPGHQGLVYVVPPYVLLNGVSEVEALAGVKIIIRHWLHMRPYDLIILAWGSQQVLHRVQPGEEGRDITVTVDYATISAAGNNPLTRVAYQVRDAGGNLPDEWARWSAVTPIDVHLNQVRPEAPWLAYPDTGTVIDLAELGSRDAEIQTWVTTAESVAYSEAHLLWAGTDSEGNSIPHTVSQEVKAHGVYTFKIPNGLVAAIAGGTASVHVLFQKGTEEQPSKRLYLDIIGEVVRWPAPTIDEDVGGQIEPDVAATVRFPLQESWPANGYLEVIFRVTSPDNTIEHRVGREVDDIEPTPEGDMLFTVYPEELLRFDGHLVEVFYAHTRPGGRPQESLRLEVVVGQLQRTMPKPIVDKAISGQLNPDDIGAYARVFSQSTDTKFGDWIRMFWIGPGARTNVPVQVAVDGTTTEHDIENYYVTNNLNETVGVFYTLTRGDEMPRYSLITEVLISRGVGDLPSPTLLEAQVTGPDTAELEPLKVQMGTKLVVTYVGMRDSDSIKVTMTGDGGSPDIPAKPGNQASQEVEFDITAVMIAANIGNANKTFTLTYEVTRGEAVRSSVVLTVTVTPIPPSELAKTVIRINEANPTTKVLDLSTGTANRKLRVGNWPFIATNSPVWIEFRGFKSGGAAHNLKHWNGGKAFVNATWFSQGWWESTISYASYLKELGNNTKLTLHFKAALGTGITEANAIIFPVVEYTVNTLPAQFPVPKLTEATGSGAAVTLAPMNAQNGGTASVEYTPMYTTDIIEVTMEGTTEAGSPPIPAKNGLTSGVVKFAIPKTAIAANIGNASKTFTLKYKVTRGGAVQSSVVLTVTVTPIPPSELAKTVIRINEANPTTKVLDLSTGTANRTLRVGNWPFIATNSPVWIEFRGFKSGGAAHNLKHWNGGTAFVDATWFSQGWREDAISYAAYLKELGNNTKLTLHFKAALGTGITEANAISFPVVEYTVKQALPLTIDTSRMTLSGVSLRAFDWPRTGLEPIGKTQIRVASGGIPPYTYTSSNTHVATVSSSGGNVIGLRNGSATIMVTDRDDRRVSYSVSVSNCFWLRAEPGPGTLAQAIAAMTAAGGSPVSEAPIYALRRYYTRPFPERSHRWLCLPPGELCSQHGVPWSAFWHCSNDTQMCFNTPDVTLSYWWMQPDN